MRITRNPLLTGTLLSAGALLAFAAPAMASDVRAQLPSEVIAQHCLANGVGSNTEGRFMLPGGQRVTGSVLCTDADMKASPMRVGQYDDDEDDDHGPRHGGRHGEGHERHGETEDNDD